VGSGVEDEVVQEVSLRGHAPFRTPRWEGAGAGGLAEGDGDGDGDGGWGWGWGWGWGTWDRTHE
jgi:hypothetical protein